MNVRVKNLISQNTQKPMISDQFIEIMEMPDEKFDIIVSNPPYIPPQEKANIQKEVLKEPDLALYTKDNKGLEFYEKILNKYFHFHHSNTLFL